MKIRLWSDVHLEFGMLEVTPRDDDKDTTLVIAGDFDVGVPDRVKLFMLQLCTQFKAVVFTCGNHEYYKNNRIDEVDRMWREFADEVPNFHFLQGDYVIIDDVRFVGGTFWTDFNAADPDIMEFCENRMNDFAQIRIVDAENGSIRLFDAKDAWAINHKQRGQIAKILDTPFAGKTVVVTHHAPHEFSIQPEYQHHSNDRKLNFAYRNTRLDSWFEEKEFTHWFHGHIHNRMEYELHGKTVKSNPRGYINYEYMADDFEDDKVFEV